MNRISKVFVLGLAIVALAGFGKIGTTNAAAQPGSLIKMNGLSSVYYLGADGKRYVFPNSTVYISWYKDFSGVVTISQSELESYPLAANITMRPGTRLVKITTNPKVYAVEPGGTLRAIPDEATAVALYGSNWNKRVSDVADAFFTNYKTGNALAANEVPAGSLVKNAGNAAVYYFDGTNYRTIADEAAFNANRFSFDNVMTISNTITAGGTAITANEFANPDSSATGIGTIPGQGTGLTVALSSNTPASQTIPNDVSVEFAKFNITASNDGDVNVTGLKLSAIGLGNASEIDEVTIYADGARLGNSKDVDSNKVAQISFTNTLVVAKGTTKTITVKAKIENLKTSHYGLSINKAADIFTTATVSGSFPINGNDMSATTVTDLGQLTIDNDGTLSNVKLGDTQATLAKIKVSANGNEDITFSSITLKKDSVSTAADDDFENVKLYMDGSAISASTAISGKYVTFNLTSPITITKNNNKRFVVKGDVIDGATKTLKLFLDSTADVTATGNHYGYAAKIVNNFTGNGVTIDAGSITIEKVNAANDKIRKDTSDVEFGSFKITANSGKNVELSKFRLTIYATGEAVGAGVAYGQIENVELFDRTNNTTYDLTYIATAGDAAKKVYQNTNMSLILNAGVMHEFVVRADVKSTAGSETYTASIASAYTNATTQDVTLKETGNDTIISDITPNSVTLKKVSVQAAGLTFSKNALSANYNAVVGTTDVEIMNFNVKAGETSKLKMTELKFVDTLGSTIDNSVVSEFKLWRGSTPLKTVSASQLSSEEITFSDLAEVINANTTVENYRLTVSLVKDSNNNGKTLKYRLSGYSVEDYEEGDAVYDTAADNGAGGGTASNGIITDGEAGATSMLSGRDVDIVGVGSLYVSMDNTVADTDSDTFQMANTNTGALASLKMRAANEDVKVTKIKVTASSADVANNVSKLSLYDGSTVVAETTNIAQTTEFDNLNIIVPQTSKTYTLKATLTKIGQNEPGVVDTDITFNVNNVEAEGNASGDDLATDDFNGTVDAGKIAYDKDNDGVFDESAGNGDGTAYTAESKKMGSVASMISGVALVSSANGESLNTSISSGVSANAAIIKVVTPASSNTLANGEAVKTLIGRVKVKVEATDGMTYTASIRKIGGTAAAIDDLAPTYAVGAAGTGFVSFTTTGTDYELAPSTEAYYLVTITPTFTTTVAGDNSLRVSLDMLNGTAVTEDASGTNFSWKDTSAATGRTSLRINDLNSITGVQIKN
jgi:hypothetical protein